MAAKAARRGDSGRSDPPLANTVGFSTVLRTASLSASAGQPGRFLPVNRLNDKARRRFPRTFGLLSWPAN
jgi:hypothetical protein